MRACRSGVAMDLVDRGDSIVPAFLLGGRGLATFWVVADPVPLWWSGGGVLWDCQMGRP